MKAFTYLTCLTLALSPVAWAHCPAHQLADAQTKAATLGQIPLQRMGSPEHIARAVAYFITEGSYVTGQTLAVDGGASFT